MASVAQAPSSPSHKTAASSSSSTPAGTPSATGSSTSAPQTGSANSPRRSLPGSGAVPRSSLHEQIQQKQQCYIVFVSNKKQVVPLWRQKAGKDEEKLVIWDYHAIFLYKPDDRCVVFDLDSDLPFPTFFHKYVTETFRTDAILNSEYHRFFRIVTAKEFLEKFSSDRRHMRKDDGTWMRPPPNYPCIQTTMSNHNLDEFLSMDPGTGIGEVLSLTDFVKRFYSRN